MINDPTKIDSRYRVEEALCKLDDIQSWLSITDGIDSFLSCLPGKRFRVSSSLVCPAAPRHALERKKRKKIIDSIVIYKDQCAKICGCNISTADSCDLQGIVALRRPTSSCDNESLLFCFSSALFGPQLYAIGSYLESTSIILTRHTISLHQTWTTSAILTSFIFDLIGGGETTRLIIVTTFIAVISPPEEL